MVKREYKISELENTVIAGDTLKALALLPDETADLVFTSPSTFDPSVPDPHYTTYGEYLGYMRDVIRESKRVLQDGRFFVITASHVMLRRTSRYESSSRIAVIFDLHKIFMEEGFAFVDDIIWHKPEGTGLVRGRGTRFSADRNPLQYKPSPVSEYMMVYRKNPEVLIDHFIRNHPDHQIVEESRIEDGYERTNIWSVPMDKEEKYSHRFPQSLADRVISYYSFKQDVVLDPFAGNGITARAASQAGRRFCMIESDPQLAEYMIDDLNERGSNFLNPFEFRVVDAEGPSEPSCE